MASKGYRPPKSYVSDDPNKRERQLANLKRGREPGKRSVKAQKAPENDPFAPEFKHDIVSYLEAHYFTPETQKPVVLEDWQKERIFPPLFEIDPETGLRKYTLALLGMPKKNSKSTIAAMIANYFLFQDVDYGEIILAANSKEQSSWIIYDKLRKSLKMNPNQSKHVKIYDDYTENKVTGTVVRIVAPNYKTGAGANPSLVIFDELWAYLDTPGMSARKFYDELTTVPTREQPLTLITTYAGFDEDTLLYDLYKQGKAGTDSKMFFYWTHENLASWITKEYLETQRKRLRPNTYLRLHENKWTASEESFIPVDEWDKCVHADLTPFLASKGVKVIAGIDCSVKGDSTAVVAVSRVDNKIVLVRHKKWQPSKKNPIDLELSVEKYIRELSNDFTVLQCHYDPYQFHRSATTLQKENIRMVEFPQTVSRLTEAAQCLYDLIHGGNLEMYQSKEFRRHAQSAMAKETARGFRIVKDTRSKKIDLIIALAMASLGATKFKPGMSDDEWQKIAENNIEVLKSSGLPGIGTGSARPIFTTVDGVLRFEVEKV